MANARGDQVWFRTDEAWDALDKNSQDGLTRIDVREESRALRFITSAARIDAFAARHRPDFRPYTLYGSGDFHHLSAVWMRQFAEPFTVLSFDNHPDWDIRPPRWSCGAWINRALENLLVKGVSIWGCGNFECEFPGRLLGNRAAARASRLLVHPWAREGKSYPAWLHPITAQNWRAQFSASLDSLPVSSVYVTIDLDCLAPGQIPTNWEAGCFSLQDLTWALAEIRRHATMIGGDLCGAWSSQMEAYATGFQKLAARFDHPRVEPPDANLHSAAVTKTFATLWPVLTGEA